MNEATTLRDYTDVTTEQMVIEQLTENTGRAICDSGDAYVRNWQRNQGRDFAAEPKVVDEWSVWRHPDKDGPGELEILGSVSLYHWMVECLSFNGEMQAEFDEFAAREENEDSNWLQLQGEFAEYIAKRDKHGAPPQTVNTYNNTDTCDLTQILQFVMLFEEGEYAPSKLIVSVHGGCDVRGGYSSPRVYDLAKEEWEWDAAMSINYLRCGDAYWALAGDKSVNDRSEDAPCPDPFALPSFSSDWVRGERVIDIRDAIARCKQTRKDLPDNDKDIRDARDLQLQARIKELEAELLVAAVEQLAEEREQFIVVHERRAYLYDEGTWDSAAPDLSELKGGNLYF